MEVQFDKIIHGADYNPEQWLGSKEIWDEDMRLMKLAHMNSVNLGIFSWAKLEPEEGKFDFGWMDEIMDKCAENGIGVVLATPSGARPVWMAMKYPEVLRVEENGLRNEFGIRHNHCPSSPVYREKVRIINRKLAERYKDHPALKMWHISNEYGGDCHCELCRKAFREWLKKEYHNDINELNEKWWNGFWSHTVTNWDQINSPTDRGEPLVSGMKLAWKRFVTDNTISFFENEIAPLREITPDIPVTTNFMFLSDGLDYQKFAKYVDVVAWDNYPGWDNGKHPPMETAVKIAFAHDAFRCMKPGSPFMMMESTPSVANWKGVNKIPVPGMHAMTSVQALAHGSDTVQYFQWRKSRGGHEKYHGAVVDHLGTENTRVFREVTALGENLEKLACVTQAQIKSRVAVVYDWQVRWATDVYCGYNNTTRDYPGECIKWYAPLRKRGISADVISLDDDFSRYDLIIAPYLYMLKPDSEEKIAAYVENGGTFVTTYLAGAVDRDDRAYLGGLPAGRLKDVFGVWAEETDAIPRNVKNTASFGGRSYPVDAICDIIHTTGAKVLGSYENDFYAGQPSVTVNEYGKGKAYYVAFRNDGSLADDVCETLLAETGISSDSPFTFPDGTFVQKRGEFYFIMNFTDADASAQTPAQYTDVLTGKTVTGKITVPARKYLILR